MHLTPDSIIVFQWGLFKVNATLIFTWLVMALLTFSSWLVTRRLKAGVMGSRAQTLLEMAVVFVQGQIQDMELQNPRKYLPFIATLFLFIGLSGVLGVVPGFEPPTSSLSTTAALALCVFLAVPFYAIQQKGVLGYLKNYLHPSFLFLPFNIMEDLTRTLALAVRLFGNIMSDSMIGAIILTIAPLLFPIFFSALELITASVQAYIFSVLAIVYIAAATRHHEETNTVKHQGE